MKEDIISIPKMYGLLSNSTVPELLAFKAC